MKKILFFVLFFSFVNYSLDLLGQCTLSISSTTTTPSTCGDGTLQINLSGGTPGYIYEIIAGPAGQGYPMQHSTAASSYTFSSLAAGSYTVFVYDSEIPTSCSDNEANVVVGGSYAPLNPSVSSLYPPCSGPTGAEISVSSGGGQANYIYELFDINDNLLQSQTTSASLYTFTSLGAGSYKVKTTDNCLNAIVKYITVQPQSTALNLSVLEQDKQTCSLIYTHIQENSTPSGSTLNYPLSFTATGNTTIGPQTSPVFFLPQDGPYTIDVIDACGYTASIGLETQANPSGFHQNNCDGTFNVQIDPGDVRFWHNTAEYQITGPTNVAWQANNTFSNVLPGSYTLSVRDNCGDQIDLLSYTVDSASAGTPGGPVLNDVDQSGSGPNYDIFVDADAEFYQIVAGPTTSGIQMNGNFTNLPVGTYTIELTKNCVVISEVFEVVASCTSVVISGVTLFPRNCNETDVTVNATSADNYEIISGPEIRPSQPSNYFSYLPFGIYEIVASNFCDSDTITVSVDMESDFEFDCIYPYLFTPSTQLPFIATLRFNANIYVDSIFFLEAPVPHNPIKYSGLGSVKIKAFGQYKLKIRHWLHGCLGYDTVDVNIPAPWFEVTPNCDGSTYTIEGTDVMFGNAYVNLLSGPTSFSVGILDGRIVPGTCQHDGNFETLTTSAVPGTYIFGFYYNFTYSPVYFDTVVIHPSTLPPFALEVSGIICSAGTGEILANATGSTGSNYAYEISSDGGGTWSPSQDSGRFVGLSEGVTYHVRATDACGNQLTQQKTLVPYGQGGITDNSSCADNIIDIVADTLPGAFYTWTGPNGFFSSNRYVYINPYTTSHIGTYDLHLQYPGCLDTTFSFDINPETPSNYTSTEPICSGDSKTLYGAPSGGTWSIVSGGGSILGSVYTADGVSPGTSVTIRYTLASGGCVDGFDDVTFNVIGPTDPIAGDSVSICEDGDALLTVSGNVGATYNWTGPGGYTSTQQNPLINNVSAPDTGMYYVTQTVDGCTSVSDSIYLSFSAPINVVLNTYDYLECFGDTTGNIGIRVLWGGTAPYASIDWYENDTMPASLIPPDYTAPGNDSLTSPELGFGTYILKVVDDQGCILLDTHQLTEPSQMQSILNEYNPVTCYGDSDATIGIRVLYGGTAPYTGISWYTNDTMPANLIPSTPNVTYDSLSSPNIPAGTYILMVEDSNHCKLLDTLSVSEPSPVATPTGDANQDFCTNDNATVSDLTTTTGIGIQWHANPTGGSALSGTTNLINGTTYYASQTLGACESPTRLAVLVTVNTNPISANTILTHPSVCGANDGQIDITSPLGLNYEYRIVAGPTWQTDTFFDGLDADSYTISVRDTSSGCLAANVSVSLSDPSAPAAPTAGANSPVCEGETINLISTGDAGASFSWTGPNGFTSNAEDTSITATTTAMSGTYSVSQTVAGCTSLAGTVSVTVNPTPNAPVLDSVNLSNQCPATTADLNDVVGTPTGVFVFKTTLGSIVALPSSVTNGTYVVYDSIPATNCISAASATITVTTFPCSCPDPPLLSLSASSSSQCDTNALSILGNTFSGSATQATLSHNGAGSLDITTASSSPFAFTYTPLAADNGNTITITITTDNPNGLPCVPTSLTYTLQIHESPQVSITSTQNVNCHGDNSASINTITINGTPAYSYLWSSGQITENLTNIDTGNYQLTVTDNNGCIDTTVLTTITQPANPLSTSVTSTNVTTNGGSDGTATLTTIGGTPTYSYLWDDPSGSTTASITGLTAGTYHVTITDGNACVLIDSAIITEPQCASYSASITSTNQVSCYNSSDASLTATALNGTAPITYQWSTTQTTQSITGLAPGTYSVTVTDAQNCADTLTGISITQPLALNVSISTTDALCNGQASGTTAALPSGGTLPYSYNWSNGMIDSNQTAIGFGTYQLTLTDANGCTATATTQINQPGNMILSGYNTSPACFGESTGSVSVLVTGGTPVFTFTWDAAASIGIETSNGAGPAGSSSVANLPAGTYSIVVEDANGCIKSESITINPAILLEVVNISITPEDCGLENGQIIDSAFGGQQPYTYSWLNNPSNTSAANNLIGQIDTLIVTDANGCITKLGTDLPAIYTADLHASLPQTNYICELDSTTLTVSSNGTIDAYAWSTGETTDSITIVPLENENTYAVTISNARCSASDSITLDIKPLPELSLSGDTVLCDSADGSLTANTTNTIVSYQWSTTDTTQTIYFNAATVQSPISVTVTDNHGCIMTNDTNPVVLTIHPKPIALFDTLPRGAYRDEIAFVDSSSEDVVSWEWDFGDGWTTDLQNPRHLYTQAGEYEVILEVLNQFGCSDTDSMRVEIIEFIEIPNVFTPNGDGMNDEFRIPSSGLKDFELVIKNRWGEHIFTATSNRLAWDGTSQSGSPMPQGQYFYMLRAVGQKDYSKQGGVTLLRD